MFGNYYEIKIYKNVRKDILSESTYSYGNVKVVFLEVDLNS